MRQQIPKLIKVAKALSIYPIIVFSLTASVANANDTEAMFKLIGSYVKDQKPKTTENQSASYSLGVKFQRDVATNFAGLQLSDFMKGLIDAKNNKVTKRDDALKKALEKIIMSKSEQSKYFMKKFIAQDNVLSIKGIYVIKYLTKSNTDITTINGITLPSCAAAGNDENTFKVAYVRMELDHPEYSTEWGDETTREGCINVKETDVIRGWRTALNAMESGQVWEVVIPPELGYGSSGLKSSDGNMVVEPDVAMRFLLKLVHKPDENFIQKIGSTPKAFLQYISSRNGDN